MKAKQHFYALGQRAKSHGVNKQRAIRHYHLEEAPAWAKHAFIAGWDAQETELVIEYRFEELSDDAKLRVQCTYFCNDFRAGLDDTLACVAEDDEAKWHIEVDRVRQGGQQGVDIRFDTDSWDRVHNVTMDALLNLCTLVDAKWSERPEIELIRALFACGAIEYSVAIRHKEGLCEVVWDFWVEDTFPDGSLFAGALVDNVFEGLGGEKLIDELQALAEEQYKDFCAYVKDFLEKEIECYASEEYAQDCCDANDYRFDETGHLL